MREATIQPRVARVATLGEAMPVYRAPAAVAAKQASGGKTNAAIDKTAREMLAERRDAADIVTRCGVDGCTWSHAGPAGESRDHAASHRATAHPLLKDRHRKNSKGGGVWNRDRQVDKATLAESRRLRQERDDAARLETIERGRKARGGLLEEAEAARDVGSASSSSQLDTLAAAQPEPPAAAATTTVADPATTAPTGEQPSGQAAASNPRQEGNPMERTRRMPKPRGYWTLDRIAEAFKRFAGEHGHAPRTTDLNGANGPVPDYLPHWTNLRKVTTYDAALEAAGLARPPKRAKSDAPAGATREAPPVPRLPAPEPASVSEERSLVDLATELEHAGADLDAARERYAAARAALADHPTIARLQEAEAA